jgi:hypothetical protein
MEFIGKEAPLGLANAVQTLFAAAIGTALGLSVLLAGALYGPLGGGAFLAMTALSLAAGAVLLVSKRVPAA